MPGQFDDASIKRAVDAVEAIYIPGERRSRSDAINRVNEVVTILKALGLTPPPSTSRPSDETHEPPVTG